MRIGCVPHLPLQQLQAFLGALSVRLPALESEVKHLRTGEQTRRLRFGALDLGLVDCVEDLGAVETEPLFAAGPLAVFLPKHHRLAAQPVVKPADLAQETLLLFRHHADTGLHDWLMALIEREGLRFREVRETGDTDPRDVLLAVAEERGVTLAPLSTAQAVGEIATVVTGRQLEPPQSAPETILAWSPHAPRPPDNVLDAAREVARQLRRESPQ